MDKRIAGNYNVYVSDCCVNIFRVRTYRKLPEENY